MKRLLFPIVLTTILIFNTSASSKLSLQSRVKLNAYHKIDNPHKLSTKSLLPLSIVDDEVRINVFITLNDNYEVHHLTSANLDLDITSEIGNIIIASIPVDQIDELEAIDAVEFIEFEQPIKMLCDSARSATNINEIHNGYDLPQAYKGKGVIVGVIDCGIDFNHINFYDENGHSRIKLAGAYNSSSNAIEIHSDSTSIATLTTDYKTTSHGTHVSGIAGGSYYANNLYGVAPESDLLLFGLGAQLSNTNVLNCIQEIFKYAENQGKPAVVNISLGTNSGSHDGTGSFNRAVDNLSKSGNIVIFASGNEGEENICLKKEFTDSSTTNPQLASIIQTGSTSYYCEVDTWSHSNEPFGIQYFIYDTYSKQELTSSKIFYPTTTSIKEYTWSGISLSSYFNGSISVAGMTYSYNNRYQMYTFINGSTTKSNYRIGVKYYGKKNTTIEAWTNLAQFSSLNNINYTDGTPDASFNDMATGKNAIAIGAYSTKRRYTSITGAKPYYPYANEGNIAPFTSYGTDINGRTYPDIVAPGYAVLSSVNEYDYATISARQSLADELSLPSRMRAYHWGDMAGTSMATPVATGTVALWLQADPTLTPQEVRDIMKETATKDSYTQSGNPIQWGAGKLNAYAGLVKVLQSSNSAITNISSTNKAILIYPNPSYGNFSFFAQNEDDVTINILNLNGAAVFSNTIRTDNGLGYVNAEGQITPGIYIINIIGKYTNHSSKLIIK